MASAAKLHPEPEAPVVQRGLTPVDSPDLAVHAVETGRTRHYQSASSESSSDAQASRIAAPADRSRRNSARAIPQRVSDLYEAACLAPRHMHRPHYDLPSADDPGPLARHVPAGRLHRTAGHLTQWMSRHGEHGPPGPRRMQRTGAILSGRRGYDLGTAQEPGLAHLRWRLVRPDLRPHTPHLRARRERHLLSAASQTPSRPPARPHPW